MKRSLSVCNYLILGILMLFAINATAAVNIVPLPKTMTLGSGTLTFAASETVPLYTDAASDSMLPWVIKLLKNVKMSYSIAASAATAKIAITKVANAALGTEGYTLNVTATQVAITAPTLDGAFFAIQTLRQLFPEGIEDSTSGITGPVAVPLLNITDVPKYEHRGFMFDPVRHFCPLSYLYQTVDRMSLFKMNRFHLLLSNDQGYRLESKVFPNLNTVGSSTQVGGARPPAGTRWYYTLDEMKAFSKYAAQRRIQVFPEIDMPGHCTAICASYPYMGTPNNAVQTSEDVGLSIMNNTGTYKDSVMKFIGKLWREVAPSFPYCKWVSMGGDECGPNVITSANLKAIALRIQDTIRAVGKSTIAWDEIATAGALQSGNWSQDWQQGATGGHIKSECTSQYLDHANASNDGGAINWCPPQYKPLSQVYSVTMGPTYKGLEATLFAEKLTTFPGPWDARAWPRLVATAEVGWAQSNSNYNDFAARIGPYGTRLYRMGIGYFQTSGVTWGAGTKNTKMTSLYDNFNPETFTVSVRPYAYSSYRTEKFFASDSYKIFDLSGRVIGSSNGQEIVRAIKARHGAFVVQDYMGNTRTYIK